MSKIYCPNCGAENSSVGGIVPNFCFNCGTPLKKSIASSSKPLSEPGFDESVRDEPTEGFEGIDIQVSEGSQKQSLQDVVSRPLGSGSSRSGPVGRRGNSEKVLEDFKNEASALKRGEGKEVDG